MERWLEERKGVVRGQNEVGGRVKEEAEDRGNRVVPQALMDQPAV